MDLGLLMSDQPVRHIEIYLLLARNNVCVSYSLVIFGVGLEHGRKKDRICDIDALVKRKEAIIFLTRTKKLSLKPWFFEGSQ